MKAGKALIVGLIGLFAVLVVGFTFIVDEREVAIKLRLGEIVRSDYEPGLHFLIPIFNNIKKFDRRLQTLDSEPQQFLTAEKKFVVVDSFVRWRIGNVEKFYRATRGDFTRAGGLLAERINTALRDEFAKRTVKEVVSGERTAIMQELMPTFSSSSLPFCLRTMACFFETSGLLRTSRLAGSRPMVISSTSTSSRKRFDSWTLLYQIFMGQAGGRRYSPHW